MKRNPNSVKRARAGRRDMTNAETRLWSLLRGRRLSARKFRRQHTIGPYVVDFACPAVRLVVEVDGASHNEPEQIEFDEQRTLFLQTAGWRVIRLTNDEIYQSLGVVEARLVEAIGD